MFLLPFLPSAHFGQAVLILIPSCSAIYFVFKLLRGSSSMPPFPPGPRPLPFIGNALDVPLSSPWLVFAQWAKCYGMQSGPPSKERLNIFSTGEINLLTIFGRHIVIINSLDVARDVLSKRSAIYSDRPRWVMGGDLCGLDRTTVLAPYESKLKQHRSLFSRGVSAKSSLDKYHPVMEHVAQSFAGGLASDSSDLIGQICRCVSISVSYKNLECVLPASPGP